MQTCREIEITNERVNSDKSQLLLTIKIDSFKTMMVERAQHPLCLESVPVQ